LNALSQHFFIEQKNYEKSRIDNLENEIRTQEYLQTIASDVTCWNVTE
jgi:hypothetical protein